MGGAIVLAVLAVSAPAIVGLAGRIWDRPMPPVWLGHPASRASSPDIVLLTGSGTVYSFLQRYAPDMLKWSDPGLTVRVVDGSTETGIRLLSDEEPHGTTRAGVAILAMAAGEQKPEDFLKSGRGDRFFEVRLGTDSLRVTFGARDEARFRETFESGPVRLDRVITQVAGQPAIRASDLAHWVWRREPRGWTTAGRYRLFLTTPGSGTRRHYEECLARATSADRPGWPADEEHFDVAGSQVLGSPEPWIALGSCVLTPPWLRGHWPRLVSRALLVVDGGGRIVSRDLFLYGRLGERLAQPKCDAGYTYRIDPRIARFLAQLPQFVDGMSDS